MGYGFGQLNEYVDRAHRIAKDHGFWNPGNIREEFVAYTLAKLRLIVTEVAEAAEALRKDDAENFHEELADICIRVFDLAGSQQFNLEQTIVNKMAATLCFSFF